VTPSISSITSTSGSLPPAAQSRTRSLTEAVPSAVLLCIAHYLSPRSLDLLAVVCQSLNAISESTFKSRLAPDVLAKIPGIRSSQLFKNPVYRKFEFIPFDYHFEGVDHLSDDYMICSPEYIRAIKLKQFDLANFRRNREQRIREIEGMTFPGFVPIKHINSYGFAELYINEYLSQSQLKKLNASWIAILDQSEIREQIYKQLIQVDDLLESGMDGTLNDGTPKHSLLNYRVIIDYINTKLITFKELIDSGISEDSHPDILKILAHPMIRAAFESRQITLQQIAESDDTTEALLS